jgi:hypothetical protein
MMAQEPCDGDTEFPENSRRLGGDRRYSTCRDIVGFYAFLAPESASHPRA